VPRAQSIRTSVLQGGEFESAKRTRGRIAEIRLFDREELRDVPAFERGLASSVFSKASRASLKAVWHLARWSRRPRSDLTTLGVSPPRHVKGTIRG